MCAEHKKHNSLLSVSVEYIITGRINNFFIVILSVILNDLTTGTEKYSTTTHN